MPRKRSPSEVAKRSTFVLSNPFSPKKVDQESIILSGSLWKRKGQKSWTRYWFEFHDSGILQYYGKIKITPIEEIDLTTLNSIHTISMEKQQSIPTANQNTTYFQIRNNEKTWILASNKEVEYVYWSNGIKMFLFKSKNITEYSDSESEESEDSNEDDIEGNKQNILHYHENPINKHQIPIKTFGTDEDTSGYIEEQIYNEICNEYFLLHQKLYVQEEQLYSLSSALERSATIIEKLTINEKINQDQYKRLQNTLDQTNIRLHEALSTLSKFDTDSTYAKKKLNLSFSNINHDNEIKEIDFQKLFKSKNQDFLFWLGIFPNSDDFMNKLQNNVNNNDENDEFQFFLNQSPSVQVSLLKGFLSQLLCSVLDMEGKAELKRQKYILFLMNEKKSSKKRILNVTRFKKLCVNQIEFYKNILKQQNILCSLLYEQINYLKIEKQNEIKNREILIENGKKIENKNKQLENLSKFSTHNLAAKHDDRSLQLSSKIMQLQDEIRRKNMIIEELKQTW